jgi:hypothetical protein
MISSFWIWVSFAGFQLFLLQLDSQKAFFWPDARGSFKGWGVIVKRYILPIQLNRVVTEERKNARESICPFEKAKKYTGRTGVSVEISR